MIRLLILNPLLPQCGLHAIASRLALLVAMLALALPLSAQGRADLSRFVVVGDSLAAGFQNFSLLDTQQVNGPVALLAQQAGISVNLPLVPWPGVPNVLELKPGEPLPIGPVVAPPPAMPRIDPTLQATNLAVPGQFLNDAINKRPGMGDGLTDIVLGFPTPFVFPGLPKSQLESAVALNPTTVLLWIGNNDALFAAMFGDMQMLTPVPVFAAQYNALVGTLGANGATLVVANIPDVTTVPYLTDVYEWARELRLPAGWIMQTLGVQPGDLLRPGALPIALEILTFRRAGPLPFMCPPPPMPVPPTPCVLRAAEVEQIRAAIRGYNEVISAAARQRAAVLVDVNALLDRMDKNGYKVDGRRLTTAFFGGLFSLDGVHPTNTANAILANEIIARMNERLNLGIPEVSVATVMSQDPLVLRY